MFHDFSTVAITIKRLKLFSRCNQEVIHPLIEINYGPGLIKTPV